MFLLIGPDIAEQFHISNANFGIEGFAKIQAVLYYSLLPISIVIFAAGAANFFSRAIADFLLRIASVILLLSFPIGMVIGAYYFWYRYSYLDDIESAGT